jgi:hypothetical protein
MMRVIVRLQDKKGLRKAWGLDDRHPAAEAGGARKRIVGQEPGRRPGARSLRGAPLPLARESPAICASFFLDNVFGSPEAARKIRVF